ncbi:MAG: Lsm family RNA-binding protein [Promethearchaeota archaeon]
MSASTRKFFLELQNLMNKKIRVVTVANHIFEGELQGFDQNTLSICLIDAADSEGVKYHRVFILGHQLATIFEVEKPFDLKGLADEISKLFPQPGQVKLHESAGVISVLDNKITVTEEGVEGEGPLAERIIKVYNNYMEEKASGRAS